MNVLDENIPEPQRQLLRSWRIPVRQIGQDLGRQGMQDREQVVPLLHSLSRPVLLTRDLGFYDEQLRHPEYCIVCLAVGPNEAASYIRRLLRHSAFNSKRKRMGKVVRVNQIGIRAWVCGQESELEIAWES